MRPSTRRTPPRSGQAVIIALMLCMSLAWPREAAADATAFIGLTPTPQNRSVRGFAFGFSILVVGFEFEYANAIEDAAASLPSLQTGSGNILVQTPIEVAGVSFYGTVGGGLYRERLVARQETSVATNLGGGVKVRVAGPLRVRVDYRVFRLRGDPLHQTYQRVYAGANLAF